MTWVQTLISATYEEAYTHTKTPFIYHVEAVMQRKGQITQVREIYKEAQPRRPILPRQSDGGAGVAQGDGLNNRTPY
jgi:hypothetical protein